MSNFKNQKIQYGYLVTASSGGTLTLTNVSPEYHIITGSSSHTIVLPDSTGMTNGISFEIINTSTGSVAINKNGGSLLTTVAANNSVRVILTDNGTAAGEWYSKAGSQGDSGALAASVNGTTVVSAGRALFNGGYTGSNSAVIDTVTLGGMQDAANFGNLTLARTYTSSCASSTRGVTSNGYISGPTFSNVIDYVTFATAGNATSFGNSTVTKAQRAGCGSATRGLFGGAGDPRENTIDYITIATTGNAVDFGDLNNTIIGPGACSSTTRGIFAGGDNGSAINVIDYVTIASTGNATDFGDLTVARRFLAGASSSTRGVFAGGSGPLNTIDYITIASTGNATTFGTLTASKTGPAGAASSIIALFAGGNTGSVSSTIDYVIIATTSNGANFGNLTAARDSLAGCSNAHGGL